MISSEQLLFSKEASLADDLVGRWILYRWPVVGCLPPTAYRLPPTSYIRVPPTTYHPLPPTSYLLRLEEYGSEEDGPWGVGAAYLGRQRALDVSLSCRLP